jgi:hypothetical protein
MPALPGSSLSPASPLSDYAVCTLPHHALWATDILVVAHVLSWCLELFHLHSPRGQFPSLWVHEE